MRSYSAYMLPPEMTKQVLFVGAFLGMMSIVDTLIEMHYGRAQAIESFGVESPPHEDGH